MKGFRNLNLRWIWPFGCALGIFLLSHQSRLPSPPLEVAHVDKILHLFAYAVLSALLAYAAGMPVAKKQRWPILAWLYGASDEFHQSFIPNREPDFLDFLADGAGAYLGWGLALYFFQRFSKDEA